MHALTHPAHKESGRALCSAILAHGITFRPRAQIQHILSWLAHARHALLGVPDALPVARINHILIAAICAGHALRRVTIRRSVAHSC
jgi:hypothetical protein